MALQLFLEKILFKHGKEEIMNEVKMSCIVCIDYVMYKFLITSNGKKEYYSITKHDASRITDPELQAKILDKVLSNIT